MLGLDQVVGMLVGAAFGLRAFDGKRSLLVRLGYGLVAYDLFRAALAGRAAGPPASVGLPGEVAQVGEASLPSTKTKLEFSKVHSIEERVQRIHEQALKGVKDPKVYEFSRKVLSRKCNGTWCIPERDAPAEVAALFAEVRGRVRYTLDPTIFDAFQTPQKTLELHTGDCDDYVALTMSLLMSVGYPVQSRVVWTQGWPTWNHIYLRVRMPDSRWLPLDPSVARPPGWEVPSSSMVRPPLDFDVKEKQAPRTKILNETARA